MRGGSATAPVYVSVDIDVVDPGMAPGTGTPEAGGLTSRELLATLRGLPGLDVVCADIVEVAPAYDHAEVTGIAAAHVGYELLSARSAPPAAQALSPAALSSMTALVAHGVRRCVRHPSHAQPGSSTGHLPQLRLSGHVVTRHEQGAGYAADGYARVSGARGGGHDVGAGDHQRHHGAGHVLRRLRAHAGDLPGAPRGRVGADVGWLHEVKNQQAASTARAQDPAWRARTI